MDLAFLRRAERLLAGRQIARIDHAMLVATLAAQRRSESAAIRAVPQIVPIDEPLVELLLAGPDWRRAQSAQRGCFSRAEAGRRVNGS